MQVISKCDIDLIANFAGPGITLNKAVKCGLHNVQILDILRFPCYTSSVT